MHFVRIGSRSVAGTALLCLLTLLCCTDTSFGQSCPVNIDFELGNFTNWQCFRGTVADVNNTNVITVSPTAATANVHVIVPKGMLLDPYGQFPTSPPNGSGYSVKLGNDGVNSQAERISYQFSVPATQNQFVITYQYAVVLEDPGHAAADQPRFTAKVFDMTANAYVTCGSFNYVATSGLPGFSKAANGSDVIYKTWSPVTINLYGLQGHQLTLEFTTADCTLGGHFGYAYVDVNTGCTNLISGINFCPSEPTTVVSGPAGFSTYTWYNSDRSKVLGTSQNLTFTPPPPDNTAVILDVVPFSGFGCPLTTAAVLHALANITFNTTDPAPVCYPSTIDLTTAQVTQNSDAGLTYSYWKDAAATIALPTPKAVPTSGVYYIEATASTGCFDIKPVNVVVNLLPVIKITDPPTVCASSTVDITVAAITTGSSANLTYTYWSDAAATIPLAKPTAISSKGTYYVKATNTSGCITIQPVNVTFYPLPVLVINNPPPVCYPFVIDITTPAITAGSDANLGLTYWADQTTTIPLASPTKITQSGVYYIKAINANGCVTVSPVTISVNPLPQVIVTNPPDLCKPDKADITATAVTAGSTNVDKLTYFTDANATVPLATPQAIADSGVYYIKATSILGCVTVTPVLVTIHNLPVVSVIEPAKVYVPNVVDITTAPSVTSASAKVTFTYFNNASVTDPVSNPKAITTTGTYYIKSTNIYGCYTVNPVNVTVVNVPQILVPKAFTPTQNDNKTLFPFLVAVKNLTSFKIYNRWGNLVFETADATKGWDGYYKGKMQFLETYTWYAEGYDYLDNVVHKSGNTILLK